jgi:hypothetical protein
MYRLYSRESLSCEVGKTASRLFFAKAKKSSNGGSTRAMMEYFKPFMSWLEEQNKGRQIGWE